MPSLWTPLALIGCKTPLVQAKLPGEPQMVGEPTKALNAGSGQAQLVGSEFDDGGTVEAPASVFSLRITVVLMPSKMPRGSSCSPRGYCRRHSHGIDATRPGEHHAHASDDAGIGDVAGAERVADSPSRVGRGRTVRRSHEAAAVPACHARGGRAREHREKPPLTT